MIEEARTWSGPERRAPDCVHARITKLDERMDRFETAMFAPDSDNEFGRPGLMRTADRLDSHLDTLCKVASWAKAAILGILAAGASMAAIGNSLGWW